MHMFHPEQLNQEEIKSSQGQSQVHATTGISGSTQSVMTIGQLTRIFAAAICALAIAFFFFIQLQNAWFGSDTVPPVLLTQAGQVVLGSAVCMLGVILCTGIPLAVVAWRSTPRIRFLLALPFLTLVLPFGAAILAAMGARSLSLTVLCADVILAVLAWRVTPRPRIRLRVTLPFLAVMSSLLIICTDIYISTLDLQFPFSVLGDLLNGVLSHRIPFVGNIGNLLVIMILLASPMLCAIAITRAMRQATIPDKWLRFARLPSRLVVFALVVMSLGLLSWGFYLALSYPVVFFWLLSPFHMPWNSWLLMLVGLLASLWVAVRALSSRH